MDKIIRSAYLKVEQGIVATIVFSNGNKSQTLVTKRQALEIGEGFVGISLSDEEWLIIRQQIHGSSLLERNAQPEEASCKMQGKLNELLRLVRKAVEKIIGGDDGGSKSKKRKFRK